MKLSLFLTLAFTHAAPFAHADYFETQRRAEEYARSPEAQAAKQAACQASLQKAEARFVKILTKFAAKHRGLGTGVSIQPTPDLINATFSTKDGFDCYATCWIGGVIECTHQTTFEKTGLAFTPPQGYCFDPFFK